MVENVDNNVKSCLVVVRDDAESLVDEKRVWVVIKKHTCVCLRTGQGQRSLELAERINLGNKLGIRCYFVRRLPLLYTFLDLSKNSSSTVHCCAFAPLWLTLTPSDSHRLCFGMFRQVLELSTTFHNLPRHSMTFQTVLPSPPMSLPFSYDVVSSRAF